MQLHEYIVLGRRNNVTELRIPHTAIKAYTHIAPHQQPAHQTEKFDSRFVATQAQTTHLSDNFEKLKQEFFA